MTNRKIKNILVVGGSGFLGSNLVKYLLQRNFNVVSFDKVDDKNKIKNKNYKSIKGNLLDKKSIKNALKNINIVYHLAGIAEIEYSKLNPYETIENNIIGTKNLLECISRSKISRVIFGSTMYVYSDKGSFYRASKQICEILIETFAKENNFGYTFLRYGSIYGPDSQEWNGMFKIISEILKTNKINYNGSGEEIRDYIHIIDAIKLTIDCMKNEYKNKSIIITGSQSITSKKLLELIFEILGINKRNISIQKRNIKNYHYTYTPYKYIPNQAVKLIPNNYIDLGSGILEIINNIKNHKHK